MSINLNDCVESLKGVGPKMAERLHILEIVTLRDLCFHLPSRYLNQTQITPLASVRDQMQVIVEGHVTKNILVGKNGKVWKLTLSDGEASIELCFFHFYPQQPKQVRLNDKLRAFGLAKSSGLHLQINHPEYYNLEHKALPLATTLTPIYPTTAGLHQKTLRQLIVQTLSNLDNDDILSNLIRAKITEQAVLGSLRQALLAIHFPKPDINVELLLGGDDPAYHRLSFEELLVHQLRMRESKRASQQFNGQVFNPKGSLLSAFRNNLAYELTPAQKRVLLDIEEDVTGPHSMMRLVQGDVGCGKTVVAAMVAAMAVQEGFQAALMAPTALLADQHYRSFIEWFEPLGISVGLLTGSQATKQRKQLLEDINLGEVSIIIGTHALFQESVVFRNLRLVIVDEQHRFGVKQRAALWEKGQYQGIAPHQLIMTATPIPRTLAQTYYTELDFSSIDQRPPGRQTITTRALSYDKRDELINRLKVSLDLGEQVYWVCTLVEDSEWLPSQSAEASFEYLSQVLPNIRIGLVHGKMKDKDKEEIMRSFACHQLQLLVATTVIEVGIDVPNATIMVIENAERLGLSQLHQLRGRVGRGLKASYCLLFYSEPLSYYAKARLAIMRETDDGFLIAEEDLKLRGPGEILGVRQSGVEQFKVANLERDHHLMPLVSEAATILIENYPMELADLLQAWDSPHSLRGH